jgi:hypothetical protein
MKTYHKLFEGTKEDVNITLIRPTLNSTRKKRNTRQREDFTRDDEIYLNQGTLKIKQIEKLSTKVKLVRELKGSSLDSFDNTMGQLNSALIKT